MQMQPTHVIVLFILATIAACAASHEPAPRPTPTAHDAVVQGLVGTWVGKGETPLGEMPIGLEFKREGNDIRAVLGGGEMYLDFRFHKDGDKWLLTEEGKFPGLGVQRHTLQPTGTTSRWIDRDILDVTLELKEPNLIFTTKLNGEPHATFTLSRAQSTVSSK